MRDHGIAKYFWAIRENWIAILVCFPIGAAIGAIFSIITFNFYQVLKGAWVGMIGMGGICAFGAFLDGVIVQAKRDNKLKSATGITIAALMLGTSFYANHALKEYGFAPFIVVFLSEFLLFDCIVENKINRLDVEDEIKKVSEKYNIQLEYKEWMKGTETVRDIADQINLNLQLKEREWHESRKES